MWATLCGAVTNTICPGPHPELQKQEFGAWGGRILCLCNECLGDSEGGSQAIQRLGPWALELGHRVQIQTPGFSAPALLVSISFYELQMTVPTSLSCCED
jgi:hypothetical protein